LEKKQVLSSKNTPNEKDIAKRYLIIMDEGKLSKILILEDRPVQVGPTTYERRQQIEGL
jgi:hypothetical protein